MYWKGISGRTDCWLLFWFWSCFLQQMNKTIKPFYNENLLFQFYQYIKTQMCLYKTLNP